MRLRKYLKPVALLAALFSFAVALPAAAYNPTAREGQRPRAGASVWTPRYYDFNSGIDANGKAWMVFGFIWDIPKYMKDLEGSEQIFEFNATVDCNFSGAGWDDTKQGYRKEAWDTNVPAAALPYEDTTFFDGCADDGKMRFGAGVMNAAALSNGVHYFIRIGIDTAAGYGGWTSQVQLIAQTGTTYNNNAPGISYDDRDCSFSSAEIAAWHGTSDPDAFADRIDAGWCAWPDWTHTLLTSDSGLLHTGELKYFYTNETYNESFELNLPPAWGYGLGGSGPSATKYCNDWTGAYEGSCFIQFVGTGAAVVYQDTGWGPAGHRTNEVAVRCRELDGSCHFRLGILGWVGPGADQYHYVDITLFPADPLQWYLCRLDTDHNSTGAPSFAAHNQFRWEVVTYGGEMMDIDYTFLGGKTKRENPALYPFASGVGTVGVGSACTVAP